MRNTLSTVLAFVLVLSMSNARCDEGYRLSRHSANAGGGMSSRADRVLNCSVGQSAADFVMNAKSLAWIGFWSGDAAEPQSVASTVAMKQLPEGTLMSVTGKVATTSSLDFPGFYYVEEPTRVSGIRVVSPAGSQPQVSVGDVVVVGTTSVNEDGEAQIVCLIASVVGTHEILRPLGMNNAAVSSGQIGLQNAVWGWGLVPRAEGGVERLGRRAGLNNVGIRVTTAGRVTSVDVPDGTMIIDDGADVGVKCVVRDGITLDPDWDYVAVTGIASCEKADGELHRVIRVRAQEDIIAR